MPLLRKREKMQCINCKNGENAMPLLKKQRDRDASIARKRDFIASIAKNKEYNTSIPKNREKTMPILRCFLGLTNKKLAM